MQRPEPGPLTWADVDRDGALFEAIGGICGGSRAKFLRSAVIGGSALLAALAAPEADAEADETNILNFALNFERLQSSFYTETERVGTVARMTERRATWARTLGAHERAHVRILKHVLGSKAGPSPFFDFGHITDSIDSFTKTAVAMEDLTVALLTGQAPRMRTPALISAFFSLLTVEARHAAWARRIVGTTPTARAFDQPKTLGQVQQLIDDTHFIAKKPRTTKKGGKPRFTG